MPSTTITGGDLKLVASQAIANVSEILLATKAFSTSVNTEGLLKNDNIQVFVAGAAPDAAAFDRSNNNYMTDNGGDHTWKPLTLDSHLKLTFSIQRNNFHRMGAEQLAAIAKPYVSKLAAGVVKTAFDKITSSNFANEIDAGAALNFDQSVVSKAETDLAKLVGTGSTRNLILNLDFFDGLRNNLTGLYANPTNNEVLRSGVIPGVGGFAEVIRSSR